MYIPRPAKLLFTTDDGWNRYMDKHGNTLSPWTVLCVERMLACGTAAMGGEAILLRLSGLPPLPLLLSDL